MPMIGRRIYPGMKRAAWGFMQSGDFPVPVLHLKFGENTGVVAYDSSPEGNDGDIEGASWIAGYLGPGLDFDGIDNYVDLGTPSSLDIEDAITIIARAYPTTVVGAHTVLNRHTGGHDAGGTIRLSGRNVTILITIDDVYIAFATTTNPITVNAWNNIGYTYDGSDEKIYMDGFVETEREHSGVIYTPTTQNLVGVGFAPTSNQFKGIIDEVLIFDVALTAAQMLQQHLGYG